MSCWPAVTACFGVFGLAPAGDAAFEGRSAVRAREAQRVAVVARVSPTVVCLFPKDNPAGGGSGVVIDAEGFGLTNFHVVAPMMAERVAEGGLNDHRLHPIEVLGIDPTGDVAMFRLAEPGPHPFAELGDSEALRVGDEALALGNPFLLADDYSPTTTLGIISGLRRYQRGAASRALVYTDCIQIDTSINPGNSGGPLFDIAGRLIGINGRVSTQQRGKVNVGVGYAISINQIKRFIPALRAGLVTPHGAAGFTVAEGGGKVFVDRIQADSASHVAGLRAGDQLLRFAGRDIGSANEFLSILGTLPARWPVELEIRRKTDLTRLRYRLGDLPLPQLASPMAMMGPKPPDPYDTGPATRRANRRAVRRALRMFAESVGGLQAVKNSQRLRAEWDRHSLDRPAEPGESMRLEEDRPDGVAPDRADDAAHRERLAIWDVLDAAGRATGDGFRVTGGDEIGGRIAVVLERRYAGEKVYEACFDDADGALLALRFKLAGRLAGFEYSNPRPAGLLRWPHRRRLLLDEECFAEDSFKTVRFEGTP